MEELKLWVMNNKTIVIVVVGVVLFMLLGDGTYIGTDK